MLATMNPWQVLLWWVCIAAVTIPLIIFTVNAILIGYYKIKEQHIGKICKAFGEVFSQAGSDILSKIKSEKNKEETKNDN